jgi:hypothetical protein
MMSVRGEGADRLPRVGSRPARDAAGGRRPGAEGLDHPRGRALGVTFQSPDADKYAYGTEYLRGKIIGMLGGRAAEEVVYGDISTGAESDMVQATGFARNMVGGGACRR